MRRLLLAAALAVAAGAPLAAQRLGPAMARPRLRDVTDTNDAQAYYDHGLAQFDRSPREAADAFYWAARINPAWGDALYARRAALLMDDPSMLTAYFEGNRRRLDTPAFRRLDSLQFRALMLSPFLYRRLDRPMFTTYIRNDVMRQSRMRGGDEPPRAELDYYIEEYLRRGGPRMQAWMAYGGGNFPLALRSYGAAYNAARDREKSGIRLERGRIFGMLGEADSAVSELRLALADMRQRDEKDLVVLYDSKALTEFSIGVLLEGAGDTDGAREAYGQALQEDLSYYPAHTRLGLLLLGKGDTTSALSELALAAQLSGDDPMVRYTHGWVLSVTRSFPEATAELQKAIELEPYFALPYLRLGQVYELQGKGPEAAQAYQGFLDRASGHDPNRDYARTRLAEVKEIMAFKVSP